MLRYTGKRILSLIPTLLIVSFIVFMFVRLIPGDPARLVAGPDATLEDVELIREELGLNRPVSEQYIDYMKGLLKGYMGDSLKTKRPVTYEIGLRYGNTVKLTLAALGWSSIIGVLIGVFSGRHRGKMQDYTGMTLAISGISIPSFWLGLMVINLFSVKLRLLPTSGAGTWKHLVLPAFTLGTSVAAIIARFTRSALIEVLNEDYIRTARSKGLTESKVIWKHAFRNAMIPVVTVVGLQFGFLLGGSVVVESVFGYPGLGSLLIDSVLFRDYPTIQSLILIFSIHFMLINLIVDILYAVLNPEVRLS